MGIISFPIKLITIILFLISNINLSTQNEDEAFVECLLSNSHPSFPISPTIFTPNNISYSSILQEYIRNLRFNTSTTRKPILIITATHVSQIQAAIVCGKTHGLQMKIRSGGHDYEGVSYVSDVPFYILDMFNLRKVEIDIQTETAWVQTGATVGELVYRIAEKSNIHGFPVSVCPTVGVGGHFSGAGYGNMMRKYGLTSDNIIDAHFVDVNGRLLDRTSMGEDVFWAIRGGGGASFGVVLSYKIHLVRVPEVVTVFRVARTLEQNGTDIVYRWEEVAHVLPEELFIRLTMDVVNITTTNSSNNSNSNNRSTGQTATKTVRATFLALFLGDSKKLLSIMNASFPELGLGEPDCIEMSWVESVLFWTNFTMGSSTDVLLDRKPQVLTFLKRKSDYVRTIIPKIGLEWIWERMIEIESTALTFNPYGGKMAEIPSSETPFPHRKGNLWKVQYATNWNVDGTEVSEFYINLTRMLYGYMTPFVSMNPRRSFFNYKDLDLGINHNGNISYFEGKVYGVKYFMGNFDRLVRVKTKVDPTNFFRNEQSIPTFPM